MRLGNDKITILLLGGGLQAVSVAYSLYKTGSEVYTYSTDFAFKYCRWIKEVSSFDLVIDELLRYIKDKSIDVVIPMSDKYALWLSQHKNDIQEQVQVKCAVPDYKSVVIASSKSDLMQLCEDNHLPVPRTRKVTLDNLVPAMGFVGFPALIKPDHSVGSRGIIKVDNLNDLKENIQLINRKYGSCSIQEWVDNEEFYFNVMLYRYRDGSFAPTVVIRISRFYPLGGGSSCFCKTEKEPILENICKKILDLLDWNGFADFDVLYDKKEQQFKVIEINPRVPASIRAADISGINYPRIMVCDVLGMPKEQMDYRTGMCLRYLGLDLMWFFKSKNRFKVKPCWFKFWGDRLFYQDLYRSNIKFSLCVLYSNVLKLFR